VGGGKRIGQREQGLDRGLRAEAEEIGQRAERISSL
jgi:hypothetical protein